MVLEENFVNNKLEQQPMIEALDQPIAREEVVHGGSEVPAESESPRGGWPTV